MASDLDIHRSARPLTGKHGGEAQSTPPCGPMGYWKPGM